MVIRSQVARSGLFALKVAKPGSTGNQGGKELFDDVLSRVYVLLEQKRRYRQDIAMLSNP